MNLYMMVGSGIGSAEAAALSARLAAWHDSMVAHERKIRHGREERCDDECPHADARVLWDEAIEMFGTRAEELTFLRMRAQSGTSPYGTVGGPHGRRSRPPVHAAGPSRPAAVEVSR